MSMEPNSGNGQRRHAADALREAKRSIAQAQGWLVVPLADNHQDKTSPGLSDVAMAINDLGEAIKCLTAMQLNLLTKREKDAGSGH